MHLVLKKNTVLNSQTMVPTTTSGIATDTTLLQETISVILYMLLCVVYSVNIIELLLGMCTYIG
jgi:hypothetical protein